MAALESEAVPVLDCHSATHGNDGLDRFQSTDSRQSPYPLTCLDHNPLPINLTYLLSLDSQQPEEGLAVLENAIHQMTKAHPFLVGDVTRQINSQRKNAWQIEPGAAESLSTLPMLQKRYFPGESIEKVQPKRILMGTDEQEFIEKLTSSPIDSGLWLPRKPVLRFQANILSDGIILAMTFNHAAIDGAGATQILSILTAYCRDQTADPCISPDSDKDFRAQIDLLASQELRSNSDSDLSTHYCGLGTWSALLAENWSGFLQSRATEMLTWRISIPGQRIQYLKEACNNLLLEKNRSQGGDGLYPAFLSKNDIVSALLAMILRQAGSSAGRDTELSLAIDIRDKLQFPTFKKYLGNMVMLIHMPIAAAKRRLCLDASASYMGLGQETLNELTGIAVSIRQRLLAVDGDHIQAAMSHLQSQRDWAEVGFRGSPIPLSSFRNFEIFSLDFGKILGSYPRDFHLHLPVLGGMCFILPKRLGLSEHAEPWEFHLALHRDDLPRIENDPLFCWATDEQME